MKALLTRIAENRVLPHLLFWSWNCVFLTVVLAGLLPVHLAALIADVARGFMPLDLFLTAVAIILIPAAATTVGLVWLRKEPQKLLQLFYGVEVPLFILALLRLFLIRELTPATAYLLGLFAIAGAGYAVGIARELRAERASILVLRAALSTVGLLVAAYVSALIAFYAVPAAAAFLKAFFEFGWISTAADVVRFGAGIFSVLMILMVMTLFTLSVGVLAAMPPAMTYLYTRRWLETVRAAARRAGLAATAGATVAVATAGVTFYVTTNVQPQRAAFAMIAERPSTDAARRELLEHREEIRAGLLNAYLAPYRYLGPRATADHVAKMYRAVFDCSDEAGTAVQDAYNVLAQPFLYEGGSIDADERMKAAAAYEAFFDVPIQKGERAAILRALEATYERDDREAGLLDEGGRKVQVERQVLNVVEHGTHAELELHETYLNLTRDQQEVFYYFSLPETAAVTGLWLGDTDDRNHRFTYYVSPRGAAQAVYKAEVARRVDPALLEQIGPRQYRLRAFPVPPNGRLHLWMTWVVLPHDGTWPLPQLTEKRNAFFDGDTELVVDGVPVDRESDEEWLPIEVPVRRPEPAQVLEVALLPDLALRAEPAAAGPAVPAGGKRYAIVLDRSYSMGAHAEEVAEILEWIVTHAGDTSDLDLYLSSSSARGEAPQRVDEPAAFDATKVVYFGGASTSLMLQQFHALAAGTTYDAIVVISDGAALDLAEDRELPNDYGAPLWMVHAGGRVAQGYDDATTAAIQRSGGGVTTDVRRVFRSLALAEATGRDFVAYDDGFLWTTSRRPTLDGSTGRLPQLAARRFIQAATKTVEVDRLVMLDRIHGVAVKYGVVTPYSSMIVLVNDEQRRRLAEAEAASDRFDREVESGQERLTAPALSGFGGELTATPEPEEWALIAIALTALLFHARRRGLLDRLLPSYQAP